MGKNLRRKMFQEQKELERETGLRIGCCLFPAKRDLGRDIFNGAVFRKPKVLFCIYESLEQTASWIGCGDTVKNRQERFSEKSARIPECTGTVYAALRYDRSAIPSDRIQGIKQTGGR